MRKINIIDLQNTVGDFVDAFNNNSLAQSDIQWYLGEMLYNGILYTGLETVGGQELKSFTNLNLSNVSPNNLQFDNLYLYFRDINKILLVDNKTFDLSPFNTGHPMFFYINSGLGFRASQEFNQEDDEILLFRFTISEEGVFQQFYVVSQRFGSSVYDGVGEFYKIDGCVPIQHSNLSIKLSNGKIKRSGIIFDNRQSPDILKIEEKNTYYPLRYIEPDNTISYFKATQENVTSNKVLNYTTGEFTIVPAGKFSSQRILYDIYQDCLIMQYGDSYYDDISSAMSSIANLGYPFPYDNLVYIPLGMMFIKSGATDLGDLEQCILLQHTSTSSDSGNALVYAEDIYARGKLGAFQNQIQELVVEISSVDTKLTTHKNDKTNPHGVTKSQVGLGKVENLSKADLETSFDTRYVKKAGNETKQNNLVVTGVLGTNLRYIQVNGIRVYVGSDDGAQRYGDYKLP